MFDALLDVHFLLCCLFEIKWTLWTVFSKLQHWNTENTVFSKTSSKSCLMHSVCPIFGCAVYLRWNDHCGQFSASCNIEIQKKRFFHKQALNHVWCTLDVQILLCCQCEMKLSLWTVFSKLQHWNAENTV